MSPSWLQFPGAPREGPKGLPQEAMHPLLLSARSQQVLRRPPRGRTHTHHLLWELALAPLQQREPSGKWKSQVSPGWVEGQVPPTLIPMTDEDQAVTDEEDSGSRVPGS